jgi:hypothetical protein
MRTLAILFIVVSCARGAAQAQDTPPLRSKFSEFVGVSQASADPNKPELWKHITFIRDDLSWSLLQPNGRDHWDQEYLDTWGRRVLHNRKHGVEMLPILDYTAPWAARRRAWAFTVDDTHYEVGAAEGTEPRDAVAVNPKTGDSKPMKFSAGFMPPENVDDWENFVERAVGFLSQPPYNIEYFQPWNEADDRFTGFWYGGMDEYMTTIHLPAARIIRKHGCKVVYGGYPCSGSMSHLVEVCDRHNAWDTIDVIDIHYFPLSSWEYLYQRVLKPGKAWGLWQTEVGFTASTAWVPNTYPRFLHWALRHDWEPDRYKIFQFAYGSPDDPKAYGYKCCFLQGDTAGHHGKALMTIGDLLDSPRIIPFTDWRTKPVLRTELSENLSSVEGFEADGRIVLAVHLMKENSAAIFTDWNLTMDNMHLDWPSTTMGVWLPLRSPADVKAARRVGIYGSSLPLRIEADGEGCRLTVPVADGDPVERKDNHAAPATTFYVVIE